MRAAAATPECCPDAAASSRFWPDFCIVIAVLAVCCQYRDVETRTIQALLFGCIEAEIGSGILLDRCKAFLVERAVFVDFELNELVAI